VSSEAAAPRALTVKPSEGRDQQAERDGGGEAEDDGDDPLEPRLSLAFGDAAAPRPATALGAVARVLPSNLARDLVEGAPWVEGIVGHAGAIVGPGIDIVEGPIGRSDDGSANLVD
jgi:hypothetical protein